MSDCGGGFESSSTILAKLGSFWDAGFACPLSFVGLLENWLTDVAMAKVLGSD